MPGRVEVHEFESRLLVGNPLGDSPRRRVPVYLPPGHDRPGAPRVPVLFALAGVSHQAGGVAAAMQSLRESLPGAALQKAA